MLERILGDLRLIRKRNEAAHIQAQPPAVADRLVRAARTTALTNANGDEQLVSLSDTIVEAGPKGETVPRVAGTRLGDCGAGSA